MGASIFEVKEESGNAHFRISLYEYTERRSICSRWFGAMKCYTLNQSLSTLSVVFSRFAFRIKYSSLMAYRHELESNNAR